MRKALLCAALTALLIPALVYAQNDSPMPMDKGKVWVYDDGAVEQIIAFEKVKIPGQNKAVYAFLFENYNHNKRMFYFTEGKLYEWASGYSRLWYDFTAKPGDTWHMKWEGVLVSNEGKNRRNLDLNDLNEGATVTLVANDETVTVPAGEFTNCWHFRITREGVADAGYVEEWFAKGVGCVQRVWDTIAGPHQQKLVGVKVPEIEPEFEFRMDIALDKEVYTFGDSISIEVSVHNWTDEDVTLEFPSSLQVDYVIDDQYRYSGNHAFTQQITAVTFPAKDVVKWTFVHKPEDFAVEPGYHYIQAELIGTKLSAAAKFIVSPGQKHLLEGIELSASAGKTTYALGEPIDFSLTAANTTAGDITLSIVEKHTLKYVLDGAYYYPKPLFELPETVDVVIPAGGSVTWNDVNDADDIFIVPGDHVMGIGILGYEGYVDVSFTVTRELMFGTVTGTVLAYPADNSATVNMVNIEGAEVMLAPVVPKNSEKEMSNIPTNTVETPLWTAVTDSEGRFVLADVPVGPFYMLTVKKEGYYPFQKTIRILEKETDFAVILKTVQPIADSDRELNFKRRLNDSGLAVTIGTDQSAYKPDSEFKAFMRITNTTGNAVSFTFDGDNHIEWSLIAPDNTVLWPKAEGGGQTQKVLAAGDIEIGAGESHEFTWVDTFAGKVPEHGGKYIIRGVFAFATSSLEGLEPGGIQGSIKVLVVPGNSQRIEAHAHLNQMYVDLKDILGMVIDMTLNTEEASGELNVTEITENLHKPLKLHRFVKMIEIDADSTIRASLDSATIRIYFTAGEFAHPEKLIIAHWRDNPTWDSAENADADTTESEEWEELETRVDTINNFVEANTTTFSSFGLFEPDVSTDVKADEQVPDVFALYQNVPNPFNPATTITFNLPSAGAVKLTVYNMLGQEAAILADGYLPAGAHSVVFNGRGLATGVYFYRIKYSGMMSTRKMLFIK